MRALLDRLLTGFGERYERAKREVSGVDFADLELLGRDLLRDHAQLRGQYAERFERIMVDELQDTNRVQLELIESISRDNLFTVGDAQQSIYRFRHAEVEPVRGAGRAAGRKRPAHHSGHQLPLAAGDPDRAQRRLRAGSWASASGP